MKLDVSNSPTANWPTLNWTHLNWTHLNWMHLVSVLLCSAAAAFWGCSKSSHQLAEHAHDHDHDECTCPGHSHDHDDVASLEKINANLAKLSETDRKLAAAQAFCVVRKDHALGSDGVPHKLTIDGRPVFLCCEHCEAAALKDPKATLATLDELLQHHTANLQQNRK